MRFPYNIFACIYVCIYFTRFSLFCTAGFYSTVSAATICNQCSPGTRSIATLGSLSCTSCIAGTYSTVPSVTCVACVPGMVAVLTGATTCTACSIGTFSNNGISCRCVLARNILKQFYHTHSFLQCNGFPCDIIAV